MLKRRMAMIGFFLNYANWIFGAIFLFVAYLFWRFFYSPLVFKEKQLQKSQSILEKYNSVNIHFNYEMLSRVLEKDPLLSKTWKKYTNTLIKDKQEDSIHVFSTVDATEYFNVSNLTSGVNIGYWSGVAGLFTGIGIFGTFLGLTAGLNGIDTTSTNTLSSSISSLLGGMSTAFVTSLMGIIGAIIIGVVYSCKMKEFTTAVNELAEQIDSIFVRKNLEEIMLDQVAESRAQRVALEGLSTDIANAICGQLPDVLGQIANKIDQSLQGNLNTVLMGLSEKLEKQSEELQQQTLELKNVVTNTNSLSSGILDQFGAAIDKGAGEEAKALGNSLQQLSDKISDLSEGIAKLIKESQDTSDKIHAEMLQSVEEALHNLDSTMKAITTAQTEKTEENIQKMTNLMEDMKHTMQDIFEKMSSVATVHATEAQASVKSIRETTKDTVTQMNDSVKALMADIAAQMKEMQDMMNQHEKHVEDTVKTLVEAVASSGKVLDKVDDTADKLEAAATSAAGAIEASTVPLTKAVEPLQDVSDKVNDSLRELNQAMNDYHEAIQTTVTQMASMTQNNRDTVDALKDALQTTERSWRAYEENFNGVEKSMAVIFENLRNGLNEYNKVTTEGLISKLKEFDSKVGSMTKNLGGLNMDTQRLLDGLQDLVEEMKK